MQTSETESRQDREHSRRYGIAADLMTENPRTIRDEASIGDALDALEELDVRHLPVVDDDGNLVGMLSDRDLRPLRREHEQEDAVRRARTPVADLMTSGVVSVTTDTETDEIIELMLDHKIGAVPVVDGEGQVVGIVSYVDVLRAILGS